MSIHTRHLRRYEVGDDDEVSTAPATSDELARQRAIKEIGRRRRFRIELVASAIGMVILAVIWAMSEYHNAGGWPTHGFSQSSGIHDVWNFWIIYPLIAWVLIIAARGWSVYAHKPISESEINREIERQAGRR
jgi:H+/Cl- antiporter ClcA